MAPSPNEADQKLSRSALFALVIGSMVGSGVFALPASFGLATAAILGGLVTMIAPTTVSLAQPNDKGVSAPKDIGAPAASSSTPNTNATPTKHRYWRHRGGTHPHCGSRRVRT
jgi:hypothetical protein